MKTMLLLPLLAAVTLPPAPTPPGDCQPGQCLHNGESCSVSHTAHFPQLPENGWVDEGPDGKGDPAKGQLKEDDDTSPDDKMGGTQVTCTPQEPTGTSGFDCTTCGDVTNEGGELKGPNGVTQNGGVEGPCIEAKAEISVTYCAWVKVTRGVTFHGIGITGSVLEIKCSKQTSVSDPPTDICPCAD